MLVHQLSSSKVLFQCEISHKVWGCITQFLSVVASYSKSNFFTVNWMGDSEEICSVCSTEIPPNKVTIRGVNCTKIDLLCTQNCTERHTQDYAPLQRRAENSQINSTQLNLFTVTFLAKLALINSLWKCKKGERLTIIPNSFTKVPIDQVDGFHPLSRSGWENSAQRNQSGCWIWWILPAHELRKKRKASYWLRSKRALAREAATSFWFANLQWTGDLCSIIFVKSIWQ